MAKGSNPAYTVPVAASDTARGVTYLHAWHRIDADTPTFDVFARYNDRFVRTGEGWRFSERRLGVEHGAARGSLQFHALADPLR